MVEKATEKTVVAGLKVGGYPLLTFVGWTLFLGLVLPAKIGYQKIVKDRHVKKGLDAWKSFTGSFG